MLKTFFSLLIVPLIVLAIDSVSPPSLCERFVDAPAAKACHKKIDKMQPDSYLAGLCQKQFSDDTFWQCLEMGNKSTFDPRKMEKCYAADFNDQQRLDCLKSIAQKDTNAEFQRMPASKDK